MDLLARLLALLLACMSDTMLGALVSAGALIDDVCSRLRAGLVDGLFSMTTVTTMMSIMLEMGLWRRLAVAAGRCCTTAALRLPSQQALDYTRPRPRKGFKTSHTLSGFGPPVWLGYDGCPVVFPWFEQSL